MNTNRNNIVSESKQDVTLSQQMNTKTLNLHQAKTANRMDIRAAKLDLVEKILSIRTETIIEKISKILDKEIIVGYTIEGKPLTKKAYNKRLEKAEQDVLNGRVTSSEDLKKEIQSWRK